jgi:hypothetical protein
VVSESRNQICKVSSFYDVITDERLQHANSFDSNPRVEHKKKPYIEKTGYNETIVSFYSEEEALSRSLDPNRDSLKLQKCSAGSKCADEYCLLSHKSTTSSSSSAMLSAKNTTSMDVSPISRRYSSQGHVPSSRSDSGSSGDDDSDEDEDDDESITEEEEDEYITEDEASEYEQATAHQIDDVDDLDKQEKESVEKKDLDPLSQNQDLRNLVNQVFVFTKWG